MATKSICDSFQNKHETMVEANYSIHIDNTEEGFFNHTDFCSLCFVAWLESFIAGGVVDGHRYGFERITTT